jgi:hypothetical protein
MALLLALLLCGVPVEATAVPIDLRLIVTASAVQLDPAHEADARFFESDRGCWKAGLRSAGAHERLRSAAVCATSEGDREPSAVRRSSWMSGVLASYLDYAPAGDRFRVRSPPRAGSPA